MLELQRARDQRHVQRQPHAAGAHRAAADEPVGRSQLVRLVRAQPEHAAVEQRGLVERVERLRERDVIDPQRSVRGLVDRGEVVLPAAAEDHRAAVGRGDRVQLGVRARSRPAAPRRGRWRRRDRASRTRAPSGAPGLTTIRASPCCHRPSERRRPTRANPSASQRRLDVLAQLDERVAVQRGGRRQPVLEDEQRAHRVDRHPPRVAGAEDVVEDLQRERPVVARRQGRAQHARHVQPALPGEQAVVAAPLQHVHVHPRRVRELQEEDPARRSWRRRARGCGRSPRTCRARDGRPARRSARSARRCSRACPRRAPRRRSAGPRASARAASSRSCAAASSSSSIASGRTLEQTSSSGAPSSSITSNFASARRKSGSGTPSKSRNG